MTIEQNTPPAIAMPIIIEDQLDTILAGDPSQFTDARVAVLEPAYDSYLFSNGLRNDESIPSSIQLLQSSEIAITLSRCAKTGTATDLEVTKISDPLADNFVGYSLEEKCIVFKGERGLVDEFLGFAESVAAEKPVTVILKAPKEVRIPPQGLEYGLKFEQFVDRVEVLECAMWIRTSPGEQEEGCNQFVNLVVASLLPQLDLPDQINANRIHTTGLDELDLEGFQNSTSANDTSSFTADYSSPLSSPPPIEECESLGDSSSDSSSVLSPPPDIIDTPPWLSQYDL
ncbi:hypothetical protein FHETE_9897 [Fusarium heterosporum]|uniref:Uncharacterized protein n=1 Tax=Fusarium heterosporum TaxID=42747 RepID=A0A8H5SSV8_FUSHE|nr:hypothetical protein FHETE_9897 [Fusarium heterosporum]